MKTIFSLFLSFILIMSTSQIIRGQEIDKAKSYELSRNNLDEISRIIKNSKIPLFQAAFYNGEKKYFIEFDNQEYKAPTNLSQTVFQAASLSKPLFAYIVMKMASEGLIDLDKPIVDYIGNDRFQPQEMEWAKMLTARVILSHKSGLPNWAASPSSKEWPNSTLKFKFKPDSAFSYSGEGFTLLQKAVENIKGKSLQEIATKEVFIPLQMNSSSYEWGRDDIPTLNYNKIAADGFNKEGENRGKGRHPRANSAYTLRTTATDYSLFLDALIKGEGLKPEYHKMIFTPVVQAVRYSNRNRTCDSSIFWGLSMGIEKNSELGDIYFHWGDNGNFKALFIIIPQQGSYLVYLTNSALGHSIIDELTPLFFKNKHPFAISAWIND